MSSSECGVSLAPNDFHDIDSDDGASTTTGSVQETRISVALERCDLCLGARRTFYCAHCVQIGCFSHSSLGGGNEVGSGSKLLQSGDNQGDKEIRPECYSDKLLCWRKKEEERARLAKRIADAVAVSRSVDLATSVRLVRDRIATLQAQLDTSKHAIEKDNQRLLELQKQTEERQHKVLVVQRKQVKILEYLGKIPAKFGATSTQLEIYLSELTKLRKTRIQQITQDIFPIEEIRPKSDNDSLLMSTVSLLADACHTAYIKGRWVYNDGSWEQAYSIVEPTLPGNGDYSAFVSSQVEQRETSAGASVELSHQSPSCTLLAGLSLTSQLVSILAYYLDITLPLRQAYVEFCGSEISETKFWSTVFKLNRNILYMCFVENAKLENLQPRHTLYNLLMLLSAPDLGTHEGDAALMQSLEESLHIANIDLELSDTEDRERDWEEVPGSLPEAEMTPPLPRPISASYFSSGHSSDSTVSSIAGGLVLSAASTVSSLWSWGGWGKSG